MNGAFIYSLALALAAPFVAAAPPQGPGPVSLFYVTDFQCVGADTTFTVSYQNGNEYNCSLDGTETDYKTCLVPGPEYSIAAYIEKTSENKHIERTLKLRQAIEFPGKTPQDTYGSKLLTTHQQPNFSVAATDQE